MNYNIFWLLLLIGPLATHGERVCQEIEGGVECESRDGNTNSYSRSVTHTSGDSPARRFEPLPPLPLLFPNRRASLFPPLRPLPPLRPFRRAFGGHHAASQTVSIASTTN